MYRNQFVSLPAFLGTPLPHPMWTSFKDDPLVPLHGAVRPLSLEDAQVLQGRPLHTARRARKRYRDHIWIPDEETACFGMKFNTVFPLSLKYIFKLMLKKMNTRLRDLPRDEVSHNLGRLGVPIWNLRTQSNISIYRVTIQVAREVVLTSKLRLRFSIMTTQILNLFSDVVTTSRTTWIFILQLWLGADSETVLWISNPGLCGVQRTLEAAGEA